MSSPSSASASLHSSRLMLLSLHILAFALAVLVIVRADSQALLWVLGRKPTLDVRRVHRYHAVLWVLLAILAGTGATLFWPLRAYLLSDAGFILKMLFVGILIANSVLIGRLQSVATSRTFASLTAEERYPLLASGAISTFSWVSAFILALTLFV